MDKDSRALVDLILILDQRNGADFAVYINTAQEYDGSDAGATPSEAISWGKIRPEARAVKLFCDATLAFPLIVAQTFARIGDRINRPLNQKADGGDDLE